ncbi:MAG: TIR domain-containing protein [Desulfobacterales bacterium]
MPKIFISYRRSDSQMVAGRLRESLARRMGDTAIFRDKNSIGAGEDWVRAIEESLTANVIVLALIGPHWASACDETGARRLDDPADWNRVELELALDRSARVIPVLIDEARMPRGAELPGSLRPLARINALKLRDDDWESDVARLIQAVGSHGKRRRVRRPMALAAAIAIVIAIGAGGWWWVGPFHGQRVSPEAVEKVAPSPALEGGGAFLADIRERLRVEQEQGLELLFGRTHAERARAIALIDANLAHIDQALASFPDDVYLHTLAGYAAKNVYASSGGTDLLRPEQRKKYLDRARMHFERALRIAPDDPGAVNGMGNVLFYEGQFDQAIMHHERALNLAGGSYPAAEHDLELVMRVKSGAVPFPE